MPAGEANLIRRHRLADESIGVEADFGRNDQVFSPLSQNAAENFLRRARSINICGIEKIAADLDKAIEDFARRCFVGLAPKCHTSEAKLRNLQSSTATQTIFHVLQTPQQPSLDLHSPCPN